MEVVIKRGWSGDVDGGGNMTMREWRGDDG